MTHERRLRLLPERLAVARLEGKAAVPAWAPVEGFYSVTRTRDELSLVCSEHLVPTGVTAERGWRALAVAGPIAFQETGVLVSLAAPLASAGVSIFALSTYDTDYLLVRDEVLGLAVDVLRQAGHKVD